ncbi:MAG: MFS transporter [Synechococcaceae cyanobacterium]|nr:MFS transporter [Synechococcaceae cyanobacterium]
MRSVQAHIEEIPHWESGQPLRSPPLSSMQWMVWSLATAGKFFEGLIVFMGGIALPLVTEQFAMTAAQQGLVTAATLSGILIGALLLGGLADRLGRKPVFIGEMVLLAVALLAAALSPGTAALVASLFVVGLALGADYPTAHLVISESIPAAIRGRLVLGAFSFQALGAVCGTAIAAVLLRSHPELETWRLFYLIPVVPVMFVVWGRLFLPESSHWLVSRGRHSKAEQQLRRLLNRHDVQLLRAGSDAAEAPQAGWLQLWRPPLRRASVLASLPWFLQDLSTYGIGIFTPVILAASFGASTNQHTVAAIIHDDLIGARGTALVDLGFLAGICVAIALADHWGRIRLQILGFIGCAAGLLLAAAGCAGGRTNLPLIVAGFLLFQFMTNLGPNAQTYLLAGEVFPTPVRGLGAGQAAAAGKVGAVLTAFLFPTLLLDWGTERLLPLLALTCLAGALVTWWFRIETSGRDLESL